MGVQAEVERGPESWQFFAFVFAAAVTLVFAVLDPIPLVWLRIVAKVAAFAVLGYYTLLSGRCRNWLVGVLIRFKKERPI
jgi:hypothetical protein